MKASGLAMSEKWHVAYFGTRVESLRRILDTGDLHATGDTQQNYNLCVVVRLDKADDPRNATIF